MRRALSLLESPLDAAVLQAEQHILEEQDQLTAVINRKAHVAREMGLRGENQGQFR